jgi:exodeoxyribonuclease VII large subunit
MESGGCSLVSFWTMNRQGELEFTRPAPKALSVTQLVRMVRETLEVNLDECWVVGEISNARLAPSGHLYLTLKDARAAIPVVMFRSALDRQRFRVSDGMQVVVRGRVSLYEARGTLQFYAEEIQPRGLGALQLAFEQLKQRLAAEGLFDAARKRPVPFLPHTIGLVTALGGAALRDMLAILLGRNPNVHLLIRSARVQGAGAAIEVAAALEDLNRDGRCEVIIVGRGGGSLEDLWAFNEEIVARAIHRSAIPVISAVGHEIDYTIADFVADLRAPTPTAAAHMATASKAELKQRLDETAATLMGAMRGALAAHRKEVNQLARGVKNPAAMLRQNRQRLDEAGVALQLALNRNVAQRRRQVEHLAQRLRAPIHMAREIRIRAARMALHLARGLTAMVQGRRVEVARLAAQLSRAPLHQQAAAHRREVAAHTEHLIAGMDRAVESRRHQLAQLAARLDSLSPLRVLERGYAVAINTRDGRVVTDAAAVEIGDDLELRLKRGRVFAVTRARET